MDGVLSSFEGFDWDAGNSNKNFIRHSVQNRECEQVFFNQPLVVLEDTLHSAIEKRWAAFGKTDANRLLVVIFANRGNLLRIISAHDMNRRERQYYEEHKIEDSEV